MSEAGNINKSSLKIYAVIVTYNGVQWIEKCLTSLKESTQPVHTIVIDNASTDDTVKIIREKFPEVELIVSEKNLGFGQANNIGLKKALAAKADYVLLLNQDAWIESSAIEQLIMVSQQNPDYGILSPFHYDYTGADPERYFKEWVLEHYAPGLKEDIERNDLKPVYPSRFVHAACWLMPLNTIERVGGFDPLFFHYDEDVDFVNRCRNKKLKIGICPLSKIYHKGTNDALVNQIDNYNVILNRTVLQLKDLNASFIGAVNLFFKQYVSIVIRGKGTKNAKRSYINNLKRLVPILSSRAKQKRTLAYLK